MGEYAPNSVSGGSASYMGDDDSGRLSKQMCPNTRANGYITNQFAGGGVHKTRAKVKGKSEHIEAEGEFGNDYGV